MEITKRQNKILEIVIKEYIENASPVSSKLIEGKYDLGVSPATIRNDMYDLIESGYLYQPHTSAGRVPTDKGYRFFVDLLAETEAKDIEKKLEKEIRRMQKEMENKLRFIQEFTRFLAQTSSNLTVSYFPGENIVLKEGWGDAFRDPEFEDVESIHSFMSMVDDFENNIESFLTTEENGPVRVYIGSEFPLSKNYNFSIMISPCRILEREGLFAILGPKRMHYDRNLRLVSSIIKLLRE